MDAQQKNSRLGGVIIFSVILGWLTPEIKSNLPTTLAKLYGVSLIPYLWMFIVAAFVAEFRDGILPYLKRYWWVFIALLIIKNTLLNIDMTMNRDYSFLGVLLLFTGVLGFAYKYPRLNIKTDISYGIYIYHMTIVNALMALGFVGQRWTLWIVVVFSCILAWVSTESVGKLSQNKKKALYDNK